MRSISRLVRTAVALAGACLAIASPVAAIAQPKAWNAITGDIWRVKIELSDLNSVSVELDFAPYDSRVLVLEGRPAARALRAWANRAPSTVDLSAGWRVTFGSPGTSEDVPQVHPWTQDYRTRYFSGIATYENTFSIPQTVLRPRRFCRSRLQSRDASRACTAQGGHARLAQRCHTRNGSCLFERPARRLGAVRTLALNFAGFLRPGENRRRAAVRESGSEFHGGTTPAGLPLLNLRYGVGFEGRTWTRSSRYPPAGSGR